MDINRPKDPVAVLLGEQADGLRGDRWQPAVDVYETEKALVVRVELAGVQRDDLRVTVDGDRVRIRGVRSPPKEREVERLHRLEIAFGPFERVVRVGVPFEQERVSASLEDGFLTVSLPKRLPSRRRIDVERQGPGSRGS